MRARMLSAPVATLSGFLLFIAPASLAEDVFYPHETRITDCTACHTEDIYTEDCHASDGYCLIARSIEELCLHCHIREDCCRLGQGHQDKLYLGRRRHPSDLDARDVDRKHLPDSLPMQDGRITCRTCHRHSRAEGADYRMLRLVKIDGEKVDWTVLCADCHRDY